MGRHSLKDKKDVSNIDSRRKTAIEKFFGLTDKVLKHIEWSIEAAKPCTSCSIDIKTGAIVAGKAKDSNGKCAMCANTGLVPDVAQRNWATGEVADRIAPKPKAVEIGSDKTEERQEIEQEVSELDDTNLDAQLKALGVTFAADASNP